jgi:RNA polymerase sigma factor (sigma-70 family)
MARQITREEFEALYRAVAPELAGYLRRQGAGEVEDLVAEVFTTAWRRRADLPPAVLRRAWLYGAARRLLLAESRRARRSQDAVAELAARPEPMTETDGQGSHDVVAAALARLTDAQRELLQLAEWERLTPAEIAVALGVRPGAARVRLHRARQALAADPAVRALMAERSVARGT